MVFVDASFLVALLHERDQHHVEAKAFAPSVARQAPWRTHALALGEVVAVLGPRTGGKKARDAYEGIRDTMDVRVPTLQDLDDAMVHVLRHDGKLSLSDGLFVLYARRDGDRKILSFDADFDKAGLDRFPAKK